MDKDLRDWIDQLRKEGDLKEISCEVDWNDEIADIERKVLDENGPALLFTNIKDYHDTICKKFFIGSLGSWRKIAWALGLPPDTPPSELMREQRKLSHQPIKPAVVKTGPVKENIIEEKDVDLFQFPVPKYHELDGGRYISTFNGVVTKDPETGWVNVGLYRGMVHEDAKSIGILLVGSSDWGKMASKYAYLNKPMEVAYVFGGNPFIPYVASSPYSAGVCEYDIAGGLSRQPVELVKCETVDLYVPANAEIVIEGTISLDPDTYRMEGPFGEYTGYYGGLRGLKPWVKVTCITHRNDPILLGSVEGHPYDDGALIESLTVGSLALDRLDKTVPGVLDVWVPPVTHGADVVVKIRKTYQGQAKQIASALWCLSPWFFKNVMVVDEDIDIHDPDQLLWAFTYRVWDPDEDIVVLRGSMGSILDPSCPPHLKDAKKMGGVGRWNRLCIDATKDWRLDPQPEWGEGARYPPANRYIPTPKKILDRWKEYGF